MAIHYNRIKLTGEDKTYYLKRVEIVNKQVDISEKEEEGMVFDSDTAEYMRDFLKGQLSDILKSAELCEVK